MSQSHTNTLKRSPSLEALAMKKKVDSRVRILVENAAALRQRAFFVIVGDRGRDQVVNLHYMLSKITTRKPSVLWCYKKELGEFFV